MLQEVAEHIPGYAAANSISLEAATHSAEMASKFIVAARSLGEANAQKGIAPATLQHFENLIGADLARIFYEYYIEAYNATISTATGGIS